MKQNPVGLQQKVLTMEDDVYTRLRRIVILAVTWLAGISSVLKPKTVADPDIWWHLATGEWILRNGHVPYMEPFSWTTAGRGYVAYTWAFDIATAWIYHHAGLFGILLATSLILLGIAVLLFALVYERSGGLVQSSLLIVAAMIAMAPLYVPRPWLLSMLCFLILTN